MDDPQLDVKDLEQDPTAISADLDGDGVSEMTMGDEDRDGRANWVLTRDLDGASTALLDTDDSGSLETALLDEDGDGKFEAATRDLDDDGVADVSQLDTDGDRRFETLVLADETVIRLDPDTGLVTDLSSPDSPADARDAEPATVLPNREPPSTPAPPAPSTSMPPAPANSVGSEPTTSSSEEPASQPVSPAPVVEQPASQPAEPTTSAAEPLTLVPDEPATEDAGTVEGPTAEVPVPVPVIDLIHGDGEAERQWGQIQTQDGYCGPVSIAMILTELTGVVHDEAQMVQAAIDRGTLQGVPGAWDGMYVQDVAALLTEFGAPANVEYGTLDTLRSYLDQGRNIILFVDSDEVWYGTDDDGTADDRQDHFLVITEIDDERGVATLNDPGWPTGVGREVSLSVIEDAWQDSGYQMVVTETGVIHGRAAGPLDEPQATVTAHPGFVILPIVLRDTEFLSSHLVREASTATTRGQ